MKSKICQVGIDMKNFQDAWDDYQRTKRRKRNKVSQQKTRMNLTNEKKEVIKEKNRVSHKIARECLSDE